MEEELITLKVNINDFYIIINSMRDDCGCNECMRVTNDLVAQKSKCYECKQPASYFTYYETYRLCRPCYAVWHKADEEAK